MKDTIHYKSKWKITKYADDEAFKEGRPYAVSVFEGNLLLNEGIAEFLQLLIGGTATVFSNANAYLGVGDSSTAAAATQTALQASTNKLYKAMSATYPQIVDQTITFRAQFTSDEANFSWNEFTAANGNSDTAKNLNRKVSAQGTKASGQTWTLDLSITFS
jgi:hypothetical protein